MYLTEE